VRGWGGGKRFEGGWGEWGGECEIWCGGRGTEVDEVGRCINGGGEGLGEGPPTSKKRGLEAVSAPSLRRQVVFLRSSIGGGIESCSIRRIQRGGIGERQSFGGKRKNLWRGRTCASLHAIICCAICVTPKKGGGKRKVGRSIVRKKKPKDFQEVGSLFSSAQI